MKSFWVPVSGALAQQKKVEVIANNVANAGTAGYKKDEIVFEEQLGAYKKGRDVHLPQKEWAPGDFYHTHGAQNAQVKVSGTYTDFQNGQLRSTGNPLDIGLKGPGFFELLTKNGIRYTRTGIFSLTPDRRLVTHQGDFVLSKREEFPNNNIGRSLSAGQTLSPQERVITFPKGRISFNREGDIFVDGIKVSTLSIVEFEDVSALKKEGNTYFVNGKSNNISKRAAKSKVYQGFIEESNVNAVTEMSELIKAHRHFESIQNAIKAYDHIAGKAVNEISRF